MLVVSFFFSFLFFFFFFFFFFYFFLFFFFFFFFFLPQSFTIACAPLSQMIPERRDPTTLDEYNSNRTDGPHARAAKTPGVSGEGNKWTL